jgi:uncharacterized membrane protein YfcA
MPHLTFYTWLLAILGGFGIGFSKSGFAGVSLLHVLIFAFIFETRDSTGIVLPMLIVGDVMAVIAFRQHARWEYIRRLLPPAVAGVAIGWWLMQHLATAAFKPLVGWIIFGLVTLQLLRLLRPAIYEKVPHSLWFAWLMGLLVGITTMVANAAGPIAALFLIAVSLPKFELVGTSAWFFFVLNCVKVPFSAKLGLIRAETLVLNAILVPAIVAGLFAGRWCVPRVPQRLFDGLLLGFAAIAALRLIGVF